MITSYTNEKEFLSNKKDISFDNQNNIENNSKNYTYNEEILEPPLKQIKLASEHETEISDSLNKFDSNLFFSSVPSIPLSICISPNNTCVCVLDYTLCLKLFHINILKKETLDIKNKARDIVDNLEFNLVRNVESWDIFISIINICKSLNELEKSSIHYLF